MKIAHIVNPVSVGLSSDLFEAQPVTFKTMQMAAELAKTKGIEVSLYAAQYAEDRAIVPEGFIATKNLEASILDHGTFSANRKLPILKDILGRLYESAVDADYLIYTNVDIGLLPFFYITVADFIEKGYDAISINRRTIPSQLSKEKNLATVFAHAGEKHPGFDCFVFKRSVYPQYQLGSICIGIPPIGRALLANLVANATKFGDFKDLHATFHFGDDGPWRKNPSMHGMMFHNLEQFDRIIEHYERNGKFSEHNKELVEYVKNHRAHLWLPGYKKV